MYSLLRPLLFRMAPERVHHLVLRTLHWWPSVVRLLVPNFVPDARLQQTLWGLSFAHPIGLAAGLDKNAIAVDGLLLSGFSFIEVGTVTPKSQPGNPQPRLFRLVEDEGLINRMGFNNQGVDAVKSHLQQRRRKGIVGVNLGKNKNTPNELAADDYLTLLDTLYPLPDYVVLNVSSPNTPGLRDLQTEESLVPLVQQVLRRRDEQYAQHKNKIWPRHTPVLVKLAPDLTDDAIASLATALTAVGIDGFIATNTTIHRPSLSSAQKLESGGLSGRPLKHRSTEVVRILYRATEGKIPVIGSGGVFSAEDAYEKIRAGASLVQVYTGFIYHGPSIVKELVEGIERLLERDGFATLAEAVGIDA